MDILLVAAVIIIFGILSVVITHAITRSKLSAKVHELSVRNEALELKHDEAGTQLSELMKLKEQADERLFHLDKYLAVAIREKELTYEQISKLEQQMQEEKEIKKKLQLKIQQLEKAN
jgi:chromosome segregation ATPase